MPRIKMLFQFSASVLFLSVYLSKSVIGIHKVGPVGSRQYEVFQYDTTTDTDIYRSWQVRSVQECGAVCSSDKACWMFTYNTQTRMCGLGTTWVGNGPEYHTVNLVPETESVIYRVNDDCQGAATPCSQVLVSPNDPVDLCSGNYNIIPGGDLYGRPTYQHATLNRYIRFHEGIDGWIIGNNMDPFGGGFVFSNGTRGCSPYDSVVYNYVGQFTVVCV